MTKCYEIGLPYYYNSQLQVCKSNDLKFRLDNKMTDMGMNDYYQILDYPDLVEEFQVMDSVWNYLLKIGYTTIKAEDYDRMLNEYKDTQVKLNIKSK